MDVDRARGFPWTPFLVAVLVGLLVTFATNILVPETVVRFRGVPVSAVCIGVTVGVLSDRELLATVVIAVLADLLRSFVLFALLGAWAVLYGGQGPDFLPFFLLFGGVMALIVGIATAAAAAVTAALTLAVRHSVGGPSGA